VNKRVPSPWLASFLHDRATRFPFSTAMKNAIDHSAKLTNILTVALKEIGYGGRK
jgi:hypothetical protein